jgi:hypothetical protein
MSLAGIHAASAAMLRGGQEAMSCPLGIHDSKRGKGRAGQERKTNLLTAQDEGQSVTRCRPSLPNGSGRDPPAAFP